MRDVESTRYLLERSNNPQVLINSILMSDEINEEFVKEFYDYITRESFTNSYHLTTEMKSKFPELFDEALFLETNKKSEGINEELSLSMLNEFFTQLVPDINDEGTLESILRIIRKEPKENIVSENIFNIVAKNDKIDELLLMRMNEENRKELLCILATSETLSATSAICKYFSKEVAENYLKDNCESETFIKLLNASHDLSWQKEKIMDVLNGNITITKSKKDVSADLMALLSQLPEDLIVKLMSISEIPYSYAILKWLLNFKDFSEEQLIETAEKYKKAGLIVDLKRFATAHNYKELEKVI